jgi:hypothetical protein
VRTTSALPALPALTARRVRSALSALVLGLALTGCGGQAIVGEAAIDPEHEQVSAEEAREMAQRVHEESVGGEGGGH